MCRVPRLQMGSVAGPFARSGASHAWSGPKRRPLVVLRLACFSALPLCAPELQLVVVSDRGAAPKWEGGENRVIQLAPPPDQPAAPPTPAPARASLDSNDGEDEEEEELDEEEEEDGGEEEETPGAPLNNGSANGNGNGSKLAGGRGAKGKRVAAEASPPASQAQGVYVILCYHGQSEHQPVVYRTVLRGAWQRRSLSAQQKRMPTSWLAFLRHWAKQRVSFWCSFHAAQRVRRWRLWLRHRNPLRAPPPAPASRSCRPRATSPCRTSPRTWASRCWWWARRPSSARGTPPRAWR